jgi:hypothetical protein
MKIIRAPALPLLAVIFVLLGCSAVRGQNQLINVGHSPSLNGPFSAVAVSGNYAYVAANPIQIFNISNPTNPVLTGKVFSSLRAQGITLSGAYAYLACGTNGLWIMNVTDLGNPWPVSFASTGNALDVTVRSNFAFVANGTDGLRIVDVSDPAHPSNVGHAGLSGNNGAIAFGLSVSGNFACVAAYMDGLRIYDISDPANPTFVGATVTGSLAMAVTVAGHYAYVTGYTDTINDYGLEIFDISDPGRPGFVGHALLTSNVPRQVVVSGNYAYVADGQHLMAFDVSNPAAPRNIGIDNCNCGSFGVAVFGDYAYAANLTDGMRTYFLGLPSATRLDITKNADATIALHWPAPAPELLVQQSSAPFGSTWTSVTNRPSVSAGQNQIVFQPGPANTFFRLVRQ